MTHKCYYHNDRMSCDGRIIFFTFSSRDLFFEVRCEKHYNVIVDRDKYPEISQEEYETLSTIDQ
jgi:hypothetical protein